MAKATYGTGLGDTYLELLKLGAVVQNNVYVGSVYVYAVEIDATKNPGEDTFLRMWDNVAPTNGTTAVDTMLPIPKARKIRFTFMQPLTFETALSVAVVRSTGGQEGTDGPTQTVDVRILAADGP